ncbi:MAG TPA: TlpA disulfide reductase family protein, partial [Gammaproteobacteria bacterium]|nr:TlpA disulfide reductase family protein [Gammaproteobacteria bacterium]
DSLLKHRYASTGLQAVLLLLSTALAAEDELSYHFARIDPPRSVPDFSLPDMDGEMHDLQDYRGRVVLINFWATWCPPCRREMPALEQLYSALSGQAFAVLAVNQWEDADHVFAYMGDLNVIPSFPILFDPESKVSADFGVKGLPTSFLLDKQGRVVYRAVGGRAFDHPEVEKTIRGLLAAE